ncbi:MAG: hypothetical protein ACTSXQ_01925 [Alphaproteobacteria bacterium]
MKAEFFNFLLKYEFWTIIVTILIHLFLYSRWKTQFISQKRFEKTVELFEILNRIEVEYLDILSNSFYDDNYPYEKWEEEKLQLRKDKSDGGFSYWLWSEEDSFNDLESSLDLSNLKKLYALKQKKDEVYFKYLPKIKVLLKVLDKENFLDDVLDFINIEMNILGGKGLFRKNIKGILGTSDFNAGLLHSISILHTKESWDSQKRRG